MTECRYAALTYDAAYTLAYGLDNLIKTGTEYNAENLKLSIINNVSFNGASGNVNIYKGLPEFNYYAQGDRQVGLHYKVRTILKL